MKILAVCGFGVGSSMVLKMTIEKVLKEMEVDGDVENLDVSTAQGTQCDLILTSNELAKTLQAVVSVPVASVKKYMDKNEVREVLEKYIKK